MAQEFTIKSEAIESKINQLLPTQGGFQPGVDFSASTMVIPIVDLTETAEGSSLRQDLQSALSLTSITPFQAQNGTVSVLSTTGYFRIVGVAFAGSSSTNGELKITITDGTTTKSLWEANNRNTGSTGEVSYSFDFIAFLKAGDSVSATTDTVYGIINGCTRQIADISGNLVNPV
jgi:hypothetical protein